jgi:hypothetical protein
MTILTLVMVAASRNATAGGSSAPPRRAWIRMEAKACLGTCPEFTLTVYEDGQVTFEGHHCVIRLGLNQGRLPPEALRTLRQRVADSGFWRLDADCCNRRDFTDAQWTYLEISAAEEGSKRIVHYHGCRTAPPEIEALEEAILSTTCATRWMGTEKQRAAKKWHRNRCGTFPLCTPPNKPLKLTNASLASLGRLFPA